MLPRICEVAPQSGFRTSNADVETLSWLTVNAANAPVIAFAVSIGEKVWSKLANVFGIGLGTGFRPTEAMGCEPNFNGQANSLWLYKNDMGALIYHAIQAMLTGPQTAVAA